MGGAKSFAGEVAACLDRSVGLGVPVVFERITRLAAEWFAAESAAYRPQVDESGWDADFVATSDHPRMKTLGENARALLRKTTTTRFARFDPLSVQADQQNRVIPPDAYSAWLTGAPLPPMMDLIHRPLGLLPLSHTRVTLTDGPFLLGWLGMWRAEPHNEDDVAAFQAAVPALARFLRHERILRAGEPHGTPLVAGALELIGLPALVFDSRGKLAIANLAARELVERDASVIPVAVSALRGRPSRRVHSVTRIRETDNKEHAIILLTEATRDLEARCADARARWALSARQAVVLGLLVQGLPNKDIATRLRSSVRTVEVHVSAILGRAKCETRSELTARFWTL